MEDFTIFRKVEYFALPRYRIIPQKKKELSQKLYSSIMLNFLIERDK